MDFVGPGVGGVDRGGANVGFDICCGVTVVADGAAGVCGTTVEETTEPSPQHGSHVEELQQPHELQDDHVVGYQRYGPKSRRRIGPGRQPTTQLGPQHGSQQLV